MSGDRGFTLTEVLLAMAISAIVGGTAYLLLDTGLSMHDRSADLGVYTAGTARTMTLLRADVARSTSVVHAGADSLVLAMPDGESVEWAARTTTRGLDVFRSVDAGSGFSERPKQAIASLSNTDGVPAALDFSVIVSGVVRAQVVGDGQLLTIDAAPWEAP